MEMPPQLTFETFAASFIDLVTERYPTPDKVLAMATRLGVSDSTQAKIIVISRFRDMIDQVSPRLYRSNDHKLELRKAIIEALEELEEEYEAELEAEEAAEMEEEE